MSDFYTSVVLDGKDILYRGIQDGQKVKKKITYKPKLYVNTNRLTKWTSLEGFNLEEKQFQTIWDARAFVKQYEGVSNFKIYGNQRWQYAFIADNFPGIIDFDASKITTGIIDIEVDSSNGFPMPEKADQQITAITVHLMDTYFVFGYEPFVSKRNDIKYFQCKDEIDLIQKFLALWNGCCPDVLTGWNTEIFDIPYLVNRITKLLGAATAAKLSPWNNINTWSQRLGNREFQTYTLQGINSLDYIALYKKYAPQPNQESYMLENIATVELGKHKVDYRSLGYKDLHQLRTQNHQLFIEYNINDVELVVGIEDKLRLVNLAMTLAYMNKVNIDDVLSQGRIWDARIYNKLKERSIIVPPSTDGAKWQAIEGAYVKEPRPGWYNWLVSFDLTSLYPHLIMMYNLSPETLVQPDDYDEDIKEWMRVNPINVDTLLNRQPDLSWLTSKKLTLTPNGQLFRTDKRGFLGEIMEEMFKERARYKNLEIETKKEIEHTTDPNEKVRLKALAGRYKSLQMALKVTLNSAYGSIANKYFRFFDVRIAEAVTLSGQLSIRWIQKSINQYLNKVLGTSNTDYVLASDTDSVYLSLAPLIKKLGIEDKDPKEIVATIDRICEQKIRPFIDQSYIDLATYVNAYDQKMIMKREAIADQAIWAAKKNYILSVYNNEGVEYDKPDIKITGWAAVRTDRPKFCRDKLKEAVSFILSHKDKVKLITFVESFRKEFKIQPMIKIASPTGMSDLLDDYTDKKTIYRTGTPIHVKGALVFNHYIQYFGLDKKYELIKARDKIKYILLKEPNPFQSKVIAFLDQIPDEFGLEKYIDYEAQFNKTFIQPLMIILDAIGWQLEETDSLEDFFS